MQRPGNDNCKGATEANSATHRVPLGGSPFFTQSVLLMILSTSRFVMARPSATGAGGARSPRRRGQRPTGVYSGGGTGRPSCSSFQHKLLGLVSPLDARAIHARHWVRYRPSIARLTIWRKRSSGGRPRGVCVKTKPMTSRSGSIHALVPSEPPWPYVPSTVLQPYP